MKLIVVVLTVVLSGCSTHSANGLSADERSVSTVYWSDGDSGRLDGSPFRLKDVDAPETGGVGAAIGGAQCEHERELGFLAKEYVVTLTKNATVKITNSYGPDRYDRLVVDLSADGIDVATAGIKADHLKSWPHDSHGHSLVAKPEWCE